MRVRHFLATAILIGLPAPQLAQTDSVAEVALARFPAAVGGEVLGRPSPDRAPLLRQATPLLSPGQPLFDMGENSRDIAVWTKAPSLFAGQTEGSFFAPFPVRRTGARLTAPLGGSGVEQLRYIIGQAESRRDGYDAVQHGALIRPGKKPTDMTLQEIFDWIAATPGQPHAIGRYQFIPDTLDWLVARSGVSRRAVFSPDLQDRLADLLLADAGIHAFRSGQIEQVHFMNNLAEIWAGLPTSDGQSYYHGYAGNRASLTWDEFSAQMAQITW